MKYREIVEGIFIDRPNRFIAHVDIEGVVNTVHVKNTGRCKELLIPKTPVRLEVSDNPNRKTLYDLVAVYKKNFGWINMDSQAPNKVVKEWLETKDYDYIKPEYKYGDSRIDFYMRKGNQEYLISVLQQKIEEQKEIEEQNKKKQAMLMNSAACPFSHLLKKAPYQNIRLTQFCPGIL